MRHAQPLPFLCQRATTSRRASGLPGRDACCSRSRSVISAAAVLGGGGAALPPPMPAVSSPPSTTPPHRPDPLAASAFEAEGAGCDTTLYLEGGGGSPHPRRSTRRSSSSCRNRRAGQRRAPTPPPPPPAYRCSWRAPWWFARPGVPPDRERRRDLLPRGLGRLPLASCRPSPPAGRACRAGRRGPRPPRATEAFDRDMGLTLMFDDGSVLDLPPPVTLQPGVPRVVERFVESDARRRPWAVIIRGKRAVDAKLLE